MSADRLSPPPKEPRSAALILLGAFAFFGILTAVYYSHFDNPFHFDDSHTIVQNQFIRDLRNIPRMFVDRTTFSTLPENRSYRPLVTASLAVDYWLAGGLVPRVFQVTTFVWFCLELIALYLLFQNLFERSGRGRSSRSMAAAAVSLYAFHTANAETLNYIIARTDVISTACVVWALTLYCRFPRSRRFGLDLLLVGAGLLAKETAAVYPLLLGTYLLLFETGDAPFPARGLKVLRSIVPSLILCAAFSAVVLIGPGTYTPGGTSRLNYLYTQPFVLVHYLFTFVFPVHLNADTDWQTFTSVLDDRCLAGILLLSAFLAGTWVYARKKHDPLPLFGALWFLITLLPTSSFIPLAEVLNYHRLFFPYVGLSLTVTCFGAFMVSRLPSSRMRSVIAAALVTLFVVGHSIGIQGRNAIWSSDDSLWREVTEKSPNNARGLMNYGLTLMEQGRLPLASLYFNRALVLAPNYDSAHINLAIAEGKLGNDALAEEHFRRAMALGPNDPFARFFFAKFLIERSRSSEATPLLAQAVQLSPGYFDARLLLMTAYAYQNNWEEVDRVAAESREIVGDDARLREHLQLLNGAARAELDSGSDQFESSSEPDSLTDGEEEGR